MSRNDYITTDGDLELDKIFDNIDNNSAQLAEKANQSDLTITNTNVTKKADSSLIVSSIQKTLIKLYRGENVTIVLAGDSVTFGEQHTDAEHTYVAFLARLLAQQFSNSTVIRYDGTYSAEDQPINNFNSVTVQTGSNGQTIKLIRCGVGGDTVLRLFRRLHNIINPLGNNQFIDLITIMVGINDSLQNDAKKYATPEEYKAGLEALINQISFRIDSEIILMTPNYNDYGTSLVSTLDPYVLGMKSVAVSENIGIVDIHKLWMEHLILNTDIYGQGTWLAGNGDTCHPTSDGHQAIANEIFRVLFANIPQTNIVYNSKNTDTRKINYDDPLLEYTGTGWMEHSYDRNAALPLSPPYIFFKEKLTNVQNDKVSMLFYGNAIYLRTRKNFDLGQISFRIDKGTTYMLDCHRVEPTDMSDVEDKASASYHGERILLFNGLDANTQHLIEVWKSDNTEIYISICGFDVVNNQQNGQVSIQSGTVQVAGNNTAYISTTINFNRPFNKLPVVVASTNDIDYIATVDTLSLTKSSIKLYLSRKDGATFNESKQITWIAISQ